jgi:hypothetical protein
MSAAPFPCPACQSVLRSAAWPPAGRAVACPRCGATFPSPGPEPSGLAAAPSPGGLEADPPPLDDEPAPEPRRRRRSLRYPEPRPRRRRWLWLLLGVGVPVLAAAAGLGYWLYCLANDPRQLILGVWQSTDQPSVGAVEFYRDGTFIYRSPDGATVNARYRFLDDRTIEVELTTSGRPGLMAGPRPWQFGQPLLLGAPQTLRGTATIVSLTRTELVTNSPTEGTRHFRRSD